MGHYNAAQRSVHPSKRKRPMPACQDNRINNPLVAALAALSFSGFLSLEDKSRSKKFFLCESLRTLRLCGCNLFF
uniref:Uncharacterized protein n=1 Tax=Candidatus Kentrum sp. DK TaxID=2126562 RepID=A0A450TIL4_9GAMM|nr:MAG: hypothetical protein BECKDK2373B_GA0170837_10397 [Candidatus Kentron sp. DK]VFJ67161.1 MAG: hypothetical protein BECKDK2373C_GA0170839_11612 [Candidatus Kentron sp. DK]